MHAEIDMTVFIAHGPANSRGTSGSGERSWADSKGSPSPLGPPSALRVLLVTPKLCLAEGYNSTKTFDADPPNTALWYRTE